MLNLFLKFCLRLINATEMRIPRSVKDHFTILWRYLPIRFSPKYQLSLLDFYRNLPKELNSMISAHREIHGGKNSHFEFQEKFLLVVPKEFTKFWKPGTGNFFYEIYASAREHFPNCEIEIVFVNDLTQDWRFEVKKHILASPNASIVALIEKDPNSKNNEWSFDSLLLELRPLWNGVLIGILFDSVWPIFVQRAHLLAKMDRGVVFVSIDRSIKSALSSDAISCGPLFLPISSESLDCIQRILEEPQKKNGVSFVGKVYPSREVKLQNYRQEISDLWIENGVNTNSLSYAEYIRQLRNSQFTLNLARANAQSVFQLKCRVLEASLAGTMVICDERQYISKYFHSSQYIYARSSRNLHRRITKIISENNALLPYQLTELAIEIARNDFWDQIESAINKSHYIHSH